MEFHQKRRQQFLSESKYQADLKMWAEVLVGQRENLLKPEGSDRGWHASLLQGIGDTVFVQLLLEYTAGGPVELLRSRLEDVVIAFEHYGSLLWKNAQNRNEPVFEFDVIDSYCQLMQLVGLCFLLHRRDLLPRIAAMQDGVDGHNGGSDTLYEEFMAYGLGADGRYESDWLCWKNPYEPLFHALTETTPAKALKSLDLFLKRWYKDLAGTAWYDSHKPDEHGNQGGYCGYWSFEAGAAVLLLGIEDDSSLHKYLYYPKDMVAWSRAHAALSMPADKADSLRLRAMASEACPRTGFWFTPARESSRAFFDAGQTMPDVGGTWGTTIWQWDEQQ